MNERVQKRVPSGGRKNRTALANEKKEGVLVSLRLFRRKGLQGLGWGGLPNFQEKLKKVRRRRGKEGGNFFSSETPGRTD